jgi:hypothetical protein
VQQWYDDTSFSGFGLDYGGAVGPSSYHPPSFDAPPPTHTHNDVDNGESGEESEDDE